MIDPALSFVSFDDEFRGYDPTLREPYSPDKVYGNLGCSLHEGINVRDAFNPKANVKINPYTYEQMKSITSNNPHLYPRGYQSLIRDSVFHRLHHLTTTDMLVDSIEARSAMRTAEFYKAVSQKAHDEETLQDMEEAWLKAHDPLTRSKLRDLILAYAQDHPNPIVANRARRIVTHDI